MENIKNSHCQCPNVKCKSHGDCKACRSNHGDKSTYCKTTGFKKSVIDFIFKKKSK